MSSPSDVIQFHNDTRSDLRKTGALPAPAVSGAMAPPPSWSKDSFPAKPDQPFTVVDERPVSTFSLDVDTAAYAYARRVLRSGGLPAAAALRSEEIVNYFTYDYPKPAAGEPPIRVTTTLTEAPWQKSRQLLHIGLVARDLEGGERPPLQLTFLVDVSGSMAPEDRLPLLRQALTNLVDRLEPKDAVAIVTYASGSRVALPMTEVTDKDAIRHAIAGLESGGGTAGEAGLRLAYDIASAKAKPAEGEPRAKTYTAAKAIRRVILATDGDFNVGTHTTDELKQLIEAKRKTGVYLSVLTVGTGNLRDDIAQTLAQWGNGNAAYIDTLQEAERVLGAEMRATVIPAADDVKIQVEFNPAHVAEYRLLGYETRQLARTDFANDAVDAGEIGMGRQVTAIYELTPATDGARLAPPLRYGSAKPKAAGGDTAAQGEAAFLRLRYKLPGATASRELRLPVLAADAVPFAKAPAEARFAIAVMGYARLLAADASVSGNGFDMDEVEAIARDARGPDADGWRSEFVQLARMAGPLLARR